MSNKLTNKTWVMTWTRNHTNELDGWHQDVTGEDISTLNGKDYYVAHSDVYGRRLLANILNYRGEEAKWGTIKDAIDAQLSGYPVEVKVLFCGVDRYAKSDTVLDQKKVNDLKVYPGARVIYFYPDAETKTIGWRLFKVSDILKYGVVKNEGGKKDSIDQEPSNKPLYYFPTSLSKRGVIKDIWLTGKKS